MGSGTVLLHLGILVATVRVQGTFSCNFDTDFCAWTQDYTDDFNWIITKGSTNVSPTFSNGPIADHTSGNGTFAFINIAGREPFDKARLLSPLIDGSAQCLTFWYQMYGNALGNLSVYLRSGPSQPLGSPVFARSGPSSQSWVRAHLDISGTAPLQVVFEASVRQIPYYDKPDIAIDDISFADGICTEFETCKDRCDDYCSPTGMTRDGSGGNIVNVAYGKPANMSSIFRDGDGDSGPACFAVNGRVDPVQRRLGDPNGNCIHTTYFDYDGWWWVDLGRQYTITNITLYGRRGYPRRMAGLSVLVENDTTRQWCYSFPNSTELQALYVIPERNDITCDPPLTGRKVWLQKNGDPAQWFSYINVCEVQVWACKDGLYGHNCERACSGNCKDGAPCDNHYGTCPAGCSEGYTGADCGCGHCRDDATCDVTTRTCPNGRCDEGWYTPYCNQSCPMGRYGHECVQQCGNCKDGQDTCNTKTGVCPDGCQPGKIGAVCKEDCPEGFYGDGCAFPCGRCSDGVGCDAVNAACPNGCQPGFEPSDPFCFTRCLGGTYGESCDGQCGLCKDSEACESVTGHCSACQTTKLLTPLCQVKKQVSESGPGVGIVVGATVAGVVVLVVIAGVLVVLIRRSRRMSDSGARSIKPASSEPRAIPNTAATRHDPPEILEDAGNPYENAEDEEGRYITIKEEDVYDPLPTRSAVRAAYS